MSDDDKDPYLEYLESSIEGMQSIVETERVRAEEAMHSHDRFKERLWVYTEALAIYREVKEGKDGR